MFKGPFGINKLWATEEVYYRAQGNIAIIL